VNNNKGAPQSGAPFLFRCRYTQRGASRAYTQRAPARVHTASASEAYPQ
jgi:hypothetical protein